MKITNELEAYLNCKTKGHLKLVGETGTKSDYEAMTEAASRASREVSLARAHRTLRGGQCHRGTAITAGDTEAGGTTAGGRPLERRRRVDPPRRPEAGRRDLEAGRTPLPARPVQPRGQGGPIEEVAAGRARAGHRPRAG